MPWPLGGNGWNSYRLQRPQVVVADPQTTEKPSKGARPEILQATENMHRLYHSLYYSIFLSLFLY